MTPQLLTLDEAADVLRCSRSTVERRLRAGSLPAVRHGRRVLVDESDLRAFVLAAKARGQLAPTGSSPAGVTVEGRLWD